VDERRGVAPVTRHDRKDQWPRGGWNSYPPPRRSYPIHEYRREEMPAERLTGPRHESQCGLVPAARCSVSEIFLLPYHRDWSSEQLTKHNLGQIFFKFYVTTSSSACIKVVELQSIFNFAIAPLVKFSLNPTQIWSQVRPIPLVALFQFKNWLTTRLWIQFSQKISWYQGLIPIAKLFSYSSSTTLLYWLWEKTSRILRCRAPKLASINCISDLTIWSLEWHFCI
jgi:hypothetical protein